MLFRSSYTKRFTHYTQLFLGFALGIAPIGAWIAMTGSISITPIFLGLAVLFWVAGFDILYSAQDYQFDKVSGLHSMVVKFGIDKAFHLARAMHLFSFFLLLATGLVANLHWPYFLGLLVMTVLFFRQHLLVSPKNLSRIDAAFFESNGLISLLFLVSVYFGI